jgi:hypothetical protein
VATGIEVVIPFGDAALKASSGMLALGRGEFADSGSLFVAALTSTGLDLTVAGVAKKVGHATLEMTKAVRNVR